jgi:hypothetical protein
MASAYGVDFSRRSEEVSMPINRSAARIALLAVHFAARDAKGAGEDSSGGHDQNL